MMPRIWNLRKSRMKKLLIVKTSYLSILPKSVFSHRMKPKCSNSKGKRLILSPTRMMEWYLVDSRRTLRGRREKRKKSSSSLRKKSSSRVSLPTRMLPIRSQRNRISLKSQLSQRKMSRMNLKSLQLSKRRKVRPTSHSLKKQDKVFQSQSRARKNKDQMYPCRNKIATTKPNHHRKLQVVTKTKSLWKSKMTSMWR